jgi:hypothetical protein
MEKNDVKICKHCKEEINKKAKRCPKCGGKLGMPTLVKVLIIIVIVFVCIIGCMSSCAEGVDKAVKETKNEWKDVNGKTSFKVGESFQNKYEKITMTQVNLNFKNHGRYSAPKKGYKYVMAKFEVENVGKDDELYVSDWDFNADADGVAVKTAYVGNDKYKDLSATLGKGKKTIGYIFYEIPVSAKKITITYNPNFWVDGIAIEFIVQ